MGTLNFESGPAARTDSQGRFTVEVHLSFHPLFHLGEKQIHFASPDLSRQALRVVHADRADQPLDVTLLPTRLIRAGVIETPEDHPDVPLEWRVYSVDSDDGNAYYIPAISEVGTWWASGHFDPSEDPDRPPTLRQFEVRLPAGRYKVNFNAPTTDRLMDLIVPAGDGAIDLPDIHLESLAWVKMLGKPAAEIEATDLEGKPVKLADYRDKVVLLIFWHHWRNASWEVTRTLEPLVQFHERFRDQPLTILLLHDASTPSINAWQQSEKPIFDWHHKKPDAPVRLLLDRPPIGIRTGRYGLRAGEPGSGQTADCYELPIRTSLIIDKEGNLAHVLVPQVDLGQIAIFSVAKNGELVQQNGNAEMDLEPEESESVANKAMLDDVRTVLEKLLGLPRTSPPGSKRLSSPIELPELRSPFDQPITPSLSAGLVIKGQVVGLDGNPIGGGEAVVVREPREVREDRPNGGFFFHGGRSAIRS